MTQIAQPMQDISTNAWTPTPVWQEIGELVPNDATFVVTPSEPQNDTFVCKLSPILPPGPGPQILYVRLCGVGMLANLHATFSLLQGSRTIASATVTPLPGAFTTYMISLTPAQIASITDYTNLSVEVTANGSGCESSSSSSSSSSGTAASSSSSGSSGSLVYPTCCPSGVPTTLYLTVVSAPHCPEAINAALTLIATNPDIWTGAAADGYTWFISCDPLGQNWAIGLSDANNQNCVVGTIDGCPPFTSVTLEGSQCLVPVPCIGPVVVTVTG